MTQRPSRGDISTFGDTPTASDRLRLPAVVHGPSTRDLLRRWMPAAVSHAVDLGCGAGHSTRLVHAITGAVRTTGVERSQEHRRLAMADETPGIAYIEHDVTTVPLPVPVAASSMSATCDAHAGRAGDRGLITGGRSTRRGERRHHPVPGGPGGVPIDAPGLRRPPSSARICA